MNRIAGFLLDSSAALLKAMAWVLDAMRDNGNIWLSKGQDEKRSSERVNSDADDAVLEKKK